MDNLTDEEHRGAIILAGCITLVAMTVAFLLFIVPWLVWG